MWVLVCGKKGDRGVRHIVVSVAAKLREKKEMEEASRVGG